MFGPLTSEENALISRLPVVTRARGGRLYGADGSRWMDCWADGGRALMGHRPGGVSLRLKNEIDRGLFAPYPNLWTRRLEKALLRLFPGYRVARIWENLSRAVAFCEYDTLPEDPLDLPAGTESTDGALWGRPLLPDHPIGRFLFPILPVPGLTPVQAVLFRDSPATDAPSDPLSPAVLAALTRSCGAVRPGKTPTRGECADIWERRGPYMVFQGNPKEYGDLFESFFAVKVLIPPSPDRPAVYPTDLSKGEQQLLANGGTPPHAG